MTFTTTKATNIATSSFPITRSKLLLALLAITLTCHHQMRISAFSAPTHRLMKNSLAGRRTATTSAVRAFSLPSSKSTSSSDDAATTNKLESLWADQVHKELLASNTYLSAAIWCKDQEFEGMSQYMLKESEEERGHALAFIEFAQKKQIPLKLRQVDAPPTTWDSVHALWEELLTLEQANTQSLFTLHEHANHDPALVTFLQPFHMEQTESEDALRTKVAEIRDESQTPGLIRQLDQRLAREALRED
jgi:ferritin